MEKKFSKIHFENSIITLKTLIIERVETGIILNWNIVGFSQLKNGVFYVNSVSSSTSRWTFRLLKHKGNCFIALHTDEVQKNIIFELIQQDGEVISFKEPQEIKEGLYVAQYSLNEIELKKNQYLSDDILRLQCSYQSKDEVFYNDIPYDSWRHKCDIEMLCDDIRSLYLKSLYYDFEIIAQGTVFKVHKLILAARSRYLRDLLAEDDACITNCAIKINADPFIMNEVLFFIYSGELKYMDFEDMYQVFLVALKLRIDALVTLCIDEFKNNINEDNAIKVFLLGNDFLIVHLKNAAFHFMNEHNMI